LASEFVQVVMDPCAGVGQAVYHGLSERVHELIFEEAGSRLLGEAIESTRHPGLLSNLRGRVAEAATSPHGNHPLDTYITVMPPRECQFIVDEFRGQAVSLARHQFACRVLRRLLQHCSWEQVSPLVVELLESMLELISDRNGNLVVQAILEQGHAWAKGRIVEVLCAGDLRALARHWIASNVVRCAIDHASVNELRRLSQVLLPTASEEKKLSQHRHGSFVARAIKRASK